MKEIIIILVAGILAGAKLQAQHVEKKIDSVLNYYAQTFNFNGVVYVVQKGKVLLHRGYGYKDRYKNIRNDGNGIYMIGSITKQFTAEEILMLASQNKLSLQDKVTKYFPGYPNGDKITLENLLTHTSGIYNYTEDTFWHKHPTEHVSHEQMLSFFRDKPLEFETGSKFEYSNSNYILLSYIIEQVTGKDYYTVIRENIIQPLGMTHTGFDYASLTDKNKVTGYNCILLDSFYSCKIEDSTQSSGAGAMYSTVEDMYKWHRALQEYRFVSKEWQEKAYTPFKDRYGYGWFITKDLEGKRTVGHSGGINGFYTYEMRLPEEDVFIMLMKNVEYLGADNNEIAKDIVKCLYRPGYAAPAPRTAIPLSKEVLSQYVGEYWFDSSMSVKFTVDGNHLRSYIEGQGEDIILPMSQTKFFTKSVDAQFEFVKNDKGTYDMYLYQYGQKMQALKHD